VFEGLEILFHFVVLRIGDEHDAIHAAEHDLAGGVVDHLAGTVKSANFVLKPLIATASSGKKSKKSVRSLHVRAKSVCLWPRSPGHLHVLMDLFEVRRFPALAGP